MPPKSPLWNYFHSNKTHYKGNKSHLNAWCKACVAAHTRRQEVESQETSDLPRSKQEMFDGNEVHVRWESLGPHSARDHSLDRTLSLYHTSPQGQGCSDFMRRHEEKLVIAGGKTREVKERGLMRSWTSLEKRWDKADQDIFILAVFFNPFIRSHLFQPNALTESQLHSIVEAVFKRFFSRAGDVPLMRAFTDYVREQGEFSRDAMQLDRMKEMFEGEDSGRNALVKLAIRILTPVPNSALRPSPYKISQQTQGRTSSQDRCCEDGHPPEKYRWKASSLIDDAANNNIEPGRPKKIPLEKLFNYGTVAETLRGTGLDFYWKGGIRNIEEELERCDNDGTNDVNLSSNLPAGADLNVDI
ncbi:hypothetical protein FPV67DRAFT_1452392 [Lyophyllum atratum]|nr:hypothetical protein FPV67DRAFT_1452392 [Lyophyllum atratum]